MLITIFLSVLQVTEVPSDVLNSPLTNLVNVERIINRSLNNFLHTFEKNG